MSIHLLSNIQSPSLSVFYVTIFLIRSRIVFVAYQTTDSFTVVSFHLYVIVKDWYVISTASFCRRETGERKKWWEWRCEEKEMLTPFPSSHRPPRAFFLCAIFIGVPSGSPCEGLRASPRFHVYNTYNTYCYDFYETKATTAWGVCVRGGGGEGGKEAVFTPILGSWRFVPPPPPPIFLQTWGTLGASIPEGGIENNACRLNLPVSQKFAQGFRAFPTSSKPGYRSWGWEQVNEGRHKIRST